mmetsp:Transcript_32069/g.47228  ORF Transcript_32069/g.47228 Transcript_32069/m.47228 type:complete len:80 (-) Transcript_32069:665-904(-)
MARRKFAACVSIDDGASVSDPSIIFNRSFRLSRRRVIEEGFYWILSTVIVKMEFKRGGGESTDLSISEYPESNTKMKTE